MSWEAQSDTPTSPPGAGSRLIGMKGDNTPDTFNVSDFLRLNGSGQVMVPGNEIRINATAGNYPVLVLNSPTGTGFKSYVGYRLNGTNKHEVGVDPNNDGSGGFYWYNNMTSLTLMLLDASGNLRPGVDNAATNGKATHRWSVVYAATGTINTSDAREKNWLAELATDPHRDAYLAAAREIETGMGLFQWADAVAEKGAAGARWHFGVIAQQVIETFMRYGLEARQSLDLPADAHIQPGDRPHFRHAFFCFDTWAEERAPVMRKVRRRTRETRVTLSAGNRFGLRLDQLLAFLFAANALMRRDLEARVAKLEAPRLEIDGVDA